LKLMRIILKKVFKLDKICVSIDLSKVRSE
jgi:hypothetical protein